MEILELRDWWTCFFSIFSRALKLCSIKKWQTPRENQKNLHACRIHAFIYCTIYIFVVFYYLIHYQDILFPTLPISWLVYEIIYFVVCLYIYVSHDTWLFLPIFPYVFIYLLNLRCFYVILSIALCTLFPYCSIAYLSRCRLTHVFINWLMYSLIHSFPRDKTKHTPLRTVIRKTQITLAPQKGKTSKTVVLYFCSTSRFREEYPLAP